MVIRVVVLTRPRVVCEPVHTSKIRPAEGQPKVCSGRRTKLIQPGPPWTSTVNSGHFRSEQKASVFTIKPTFTGKAGRQGRAVPSLRPGLPPAFKSWLGYLWAVTLSKAPQLSSWFTELQNGNNNNPTTYSGSLVNADWLMHVDSLGQDPALSKRSEGASLQDDFSTAEASQAS